MSRSIKIGFQITNFKEEDTEFKWFNQNHLATDRLEPRSYKLKIHFYISLNLKFSSLVKGFIDPGTDPETKNHCVLGARGHEEECVQQHGDDSTKAPLTHSLAALENEVWLNIPTSQYHLWDQRKLHVKMS